VTTHYDVLYNRRLEIARGVQRLGSCGVGFGATIDRHLGARVQFYAGELLTPKICQQRLKQIKAYYQCKFEKDAGISFDFFKHYEEDLKFLQNIDELHTLVKKAQVSFVREEKIFQCNDWENYVFEGAQGILLDQRFGNKPFITKSNTTSQNAISLLRQNSKLRASDVSIYYVTRSYLTRHGGGPFNKLPNGFELKNIGSETNILNEFQGEFKKGVLNLNLINYAIKCDSGFSKDLQKNLIITCIDQLPENTINYCIDDEVKCSPIKLFPKLLNARFDRELFSYHPCGDELESLLSKA